MKLCFATHNPHKIREIQKIVPNHIKIISLEELNYTEEICETGKTLEENSEIKARFIYTKKSMPVFADDSGLEIDALNGQPGVYSARYAGLQKNSKANIDKVLQQMEGFENRSARFKSVITYINQHGNSFSFLGTVEGEVITKTIGTEGFGYDPIFVPNGHKRTFAQMSTKEKNTLSHRARAFKEFINFLKKSV